MPQRSKSEILTSVSTSITDASPQVHVDAAKGPFFYLAAQGVAGPLATASADTERMALLSTLQFPTVATAAEALAVARAFGLRLGSGGFSSGIAYFFTGRRPLGTDVFTVEEGATVSTATSRGQVFQTVESRSLTAANADTYFNPAARRYELPVQVRALAAGNGGNIPSRTINTVQNGAASFDGVTNIATFRGGTVAQTTSNLYARTQQKLQGLDTFSRGGLLSTVLNVDVDRIQAASLTYSSEYPTLFYRLPDQPALDTWVLNTVQDTLTTDSFTASGGQTQFILSKKPALFLTAAFVNGAPVTATLVLDPDLGLGRSVRENSYIMLDVPAIAGDVVDITYGYDAVLNTIQSTLAGLLDSTIGELFATDVLVRYPRSLPIVGTVTGTVLGTFDPTTVENEVLTVFSDYTSNGLGDAPALGGARAANELRDQIRAKVPGVATLAIPVFGRKSLGNIVEAIDIPRNAKITIEAEADVFVKFT